MSRQINEKIIINQLLSKLSQMTIYDFEEIENSYKIVESIDDLIYSILEAPKLNVSLSGMCKILMRE